ncbi:hypothetical protein [Empedobacter sp.]|uniref:hypothetical protein n=1 Tax=Empedobacter sp. TaxID=1927715 RepID=UPI0028A25AFD|nr:hypothetical protein [Empedobacter sp.]
MKKLLLALAFLPMLSFAQDSSTEINKLYNLQPQAKYIKLTTDPVFFVDGERVDKSVFTKINPDDIKYITVIKTDKKYPNGKIDIVSKKEKKS